MLRKVKEKYDSVRTLQPQRKIAMTTELNLDDLLAQQKTIEDAIAKARKEKKDEAIKDVVSIIKKYAITVKDLSGAFGYEPPEELKKKVKKVYGTATPKYQYLHNGKMEFWSGRGSEITRPKTLVAFLNDKKITIDQFKNDEKYKYKPEVK